jgi:hypothetical protein
MANSNAKDKGEWEEDDVAEAADETEPDDYKKQARDAAKKGASKGKGDS